MKSELKLKSTVLSAYLVGCIFFSFFFIFSFFLFFFHRHLCVRFTLFAALILLLCSFFFCSKRLMMMKDLHSPCYSEYYDFGAYQHQSVIIKITTIMMKKNCVNKHQNECEMMGGCCFYLLALSFILI